MSVTVSAAPTGGSGTDTGSPYSLAQTGSQWTYTVPTTGQTTWSTTQHTFSVLVNGALLNPLVAQSMIVCTYVAPGQRSSAQNQC
jgi:archaellum component FlaG (FlaF/FlaG flagellin family)